MRALLRLAAFCALPALAFAACQQSNLTTGNQSDGAVYQLYMPETTCWNGDLVIFAHGYVQPGPMLAVPQDQLTIGGISLPATFNQLGYGFAASSYSTNGLAIVQGVHDTLDLTKNILGPQLHPKHVYLIGASEGGLVTALSAEQLPGVYSSAGAACGPIGNFQNQINYFGDFRVIFDYFFPGVIPGTAISVPSEVMTDWNSVYVPRITTDLAANPSATSQLINVMQAPVTSDPSTIAETVLDVLWYNVFGTADAQTKLDGQPYDNHYRIYFGSNNDFLLNLKVERYTASPTALAMVASQYQTSGKLQMPLVTLHTTGDPVIPYWHETLYTLKTLFAGTLLDRINLPISAYGHCNFTAAEVLGAFALVVLTGTGNDVTADVRTALPASEQDRFTEILHHLPPGSEPRP
jgi:pimeloyl-ACP methyl ester carboxylesterase